MRVPYHGIHRNQYEDYYRQQLGGGLPYFTGSKIQHGRGLGSLFSSLFRNALPMLRRGLSIFGKHALRTGLDVASDVINRGEGIKDSAQKRIPEGIKRFATEESIIPQEGSGLHRRKRKRSAKAKKHRKIKKHKIEDIFA